MLFVGLAESYGVAREGYFKIDPLRGGESAIKGFYAPNKKTVVARFEWLFQIERDGFPLDAGGKGAARGLQVKLCALYAY